MSRQLVIVRGMRKAFSNEIHNSMRLHSSHVEGQVSEYDLMQIKYCEKGQPYHADFRNRRAAATSILRFVETLGSPTMTPTRGRALVISESELYMVFESIRSLISSSFSDSEFVRDMLESTLIMETDNDYTDVVYIHLMKRLTRYVPEPALSKHGTRKFKLYLEVNR